MFPPVTNLNGSTTPNVSVGPFQQIAFHLLPLLSSSRPNSIAKPTPTSSQRSSSPEFSPTLPALPSSQDSFNAFTLLACSSSSCGKSPLSRTTPRDSSTPMSSRQCIQFGKRPPSSPPGMLGDEKPYFHTTSPSSANSTLESVIAEASKHLHDRLLR